MHDNTRDYMILAYKILQTTTDGQYKNKKRAEDYATIHDIHIDRREYMRGHEIADEFATLTLRKSREFDSEL